MRILITVAAGFLGSHLCEKYVQDGKLVYGLDNLMNGNSTIFELYYIKKTSNLFMMIFVGMNCIINYHQSWMQ
jgi:nucleoside-diphosphate-sugar epimerase